MKRRILYITAFCIYIGAILYLCLTKPDNLPQTEFLIFGLPADKVAHFTMFLPFPILMYSLYVICLNIHLLGQMILRVLP